jgi:hypothetical protein
VDAGVRDGRQADERVVDQGAARDAAMIQEEGSSDEDGAHLDLSR